MFNQNIIIGLIMALISIIKVGVMALVYFPTVKYFFL